MTVITGRIEDATGTPLENVTVTCQLRPRPAFVTASGVELAPMVATTTDANGDYSFDLVETADITPDDSFYVIIERIPDRYGGPVQHVIQVGASPATVYASLVSVPPANDTATYLTQAAGDARYVQAPGSFASSIVDSRPNDAHTAGVATDYARGDHRHERETTYGTAAARAALTGNDLYEGLRFRETDSTDKLYEYRAAAWVQRQDTLVVADATARDALTNPYMGMRVITADNGLRFWYDGSGWYLEGEQLISSTTLGSAATSINSGTLPVIPNGYTLRIVTRGKITAGGGVGVGGSFMRFNGISTAAYVWQLLQSVDVTASAFESAGSATSINGPDIGNDASNIFAQWEVTVFDYRTSVPKNLMGRGYYPGNLNTQQLRFVAGWFSDANPITSVQWHTALSTFIAGTSMQVFARSSKG